MRKVIISTKEDLSYGTLLWIYSKNKKVYHSSKCVNSEAAFSDYDSNYMGKVEELYRNLDKQPALFDRMLSSTDRIFGICLNNRRISDDSKEVKVLFFPSWEEVQDFAERDFPVLIETEKNRRKEAKQKWMERGKAFSSKKKLPQ